VLHARSPAAVPPTAAAAPSAPFLKASLPAAKPVPASAPAADHVHVACPAAPAIAAAGRDDGLARLQSEPHGASDVAALILSGKESAAAGRPRDAEILFLAACRGADQLQRADATEPIEARYQLARHYGHVLQISAPPLFNRAELVQRALALYTDSVQAYRARFGDAHEKTKFAAEGLAQLQQALAQAPAIAARPAPEVVAVKPPPPPAPKVAIAAEPPPPAPVAAPRPAIAAVARAPRPRPIEVVTAPVRQATGAANRELDDSQ
jgi:hypothetical protein